MAWAIPAELPFEGKLSNAQGELISGSIQLEFRIFENQEGGEALGGWEESHDLEVEGGLVKLVLGSINSLPVEELGGPRWLEMTVVDGEGPERMPRLSLGGAAYALQAASVASLTPEQEEVLRGPQGERGVPGTDGVDGVQGERGEQGLQGVPGESGEQGLQGEQGPQGEQGLQGEPGGLGLLNVDTGIFSSVFTHNVSASDVPLEDPQNGNPTVSVINVPYAGVIRDIRLFIQIDHSDSSELIIALTSPSGREIILHDMGLGTGDDISGEYPTERQPASGSMDDFFGDQSSGDWILRITDPVVGNIATLLEWSLTIRLVSSDNLDINGSLKVEDLIIGEHRPLSGILGAVASENIVYINPREFTKTGDLESSTVAEVEINVIGTIRVTFDGSASRFNGGSGRILKNNSFLEDFLFMNSDWTTYSLDVRVLPGDRIRLDCRTSNSDYFVWVRNFTIRYDKVTLEEVVEIPY